MVFIFSMFFLFEKKWFIEFMVKFKISKLRVFYEEIFFFGSKFVRMFGKVFEV